MSNINVQIIESFIIIAVYLIHFFISRSLISNRLKIFNLNVGRRKLILKILNTTSSVIAFIF